ncbi:DNA-directed RNA polymerase V subunit 7-like [Panicum miliaceum]|uniref:DNA-directed RNA polymerase subunit n=1 Tax=Panicum miliaceum TaxID=4540 RepID=A0A3L6SXV5_PANMI|nr:DNA-directed RNA polymerase V subunit 7-like [Panicum miliaceum]
MEAGFRKQCIAGKLRLAFGSLLNPNVIVFTPGIVVEVMLVKLVDGMSENPSVAVGVLGFRRTSQGHSAGSAVRCSAMVFLEAEMSWNVLISPRELDRKGLLLRKAIIVRLLEDVTNRRASKEHGYYIAVNQLKAISEGKVRELTGDVLFPVTFTCITQKPMKGEVMVGYVDRILKHGVFLKSGPVESIFMAEKSMSDYKYIGGENPMFMNDHSKLEKDTAIRFKVMGLRWMEADRQFQLLATIAGDFLGPL